jgi:c(7)-type cytochrome triheme protein
MSKMKKINSILAVLIGASCSVFFGQLIAADEERPAIVPIGKVNVSTAKSEPAPAPVEAKPTQPATPSPAVAPGGKVDGAGVVNSSCAACHVAGVLNAPKLGNKVDWEPRIKQGLKVLYDHAINGFQAMPPRGGNPTLTDEQIQAAVDHMVNLAKGAGTTAADATTKDSKVVKPQETAVAESKPVPVSTPKREAEVVKNEGNDNGKKTKKVKSQRRANTFNRLMKPPSQRNPPPAKDGIHDPDNPGTHMLQPPKEAFAALAKSNSGNRVDWVRSLDRGALAPRYDRFDESKKPVVLDLNIVREVKGSMPDVVYPHKQHTEWLDCSNCHPKIFIPKKRANDISMAAILLGEKCGVCHGKVAFPVSECRKCHSQNKTGKK